MEQKLFYTQPNSSAFSAKLTKIIPLDNHCFGLILDATAFYPEGGGQPCDTGTIQDYPIIDVQERDGQIIHIINEPIDMNLLNTNVKGIVNWRRRFDHMQQHSGQHILSAVFYNTFHAKTVGFHMGSESCQIDLAMDELTLEMANQVECLANELIFANKPIVTKWIGTDELPLFPIRKIPAKKIENARLVYIEDFDYSLCCGTHTATTGAIGLVKIRHWERKNNAVRIDFVCGGRALQDYQYKNALLNRLSNQFSSALPSLEAAIEQTVAKSERLIKELLHAKQALYQQLAVQLAEETEPLKNGVTIVTHIMNDAYPQDVNMLAKELLQRPKTIVLLAGVDAEKSKNHLVFSAVGDIANIHMGQQLKNTLAKLGGKGGGSATAAQGGCAHSGNLCAALEQAKTDIIAVLLKG